MGRASRAASREESRGKGEIVLIQKVTLLSLHQSKPIGVMEITYRWLRKEDKLNFAQAGEAPQIVVWNPGSKKAECAPSSSLLNLHRLSVRGHYPRSPVRNRAFLTIFA
jgi:hypothetical protein